MVEFEKPPKSGQVRFIEGILLLILMALVIGALISIAISAAGQPALPPPPNRPVTPSR